MDTKTLQELSSKLSQLNFPHTVFGIIAFGSRIKGIYTDDSDLDLLVVASGISSKRQRRGEEIVALKKLLPPMPLDILLLTREETLSNFRNHNPLFLDIATEGIVLSDTDNFLLSLIEETKQYLYKSKIIKSRDTWIFPVKAGTPTFLSKVSNKDFSYAMLKDGERDLEIGKKLKDEAYFDKSVYHLQQAIEKFIKAILISAGIFKKTHFVGVELRKIIEEGNIIPGDWIERLLDAAQISESIEPEVSLSRYPGISEDTLWIPFDEYEDIDATTALQKAEKVQLTAVSFINFWFDKK